MTQTASVWLVVALAFITANLPFVTERWLAVWPSRGAGKGLWGRAAELVFWYAVVGAVGLGLEQYLGQIYPQGWEFYAITGAMFLTLAFPGFVYRYLAHRR